MGRESRITRGRMEAFVADIFAAHVSVKLHRVRQEMKTAPGGVMQPVSRTPVANTFEAAAEGKSPKEALEAALVELEAAVRDGMGGISLIQVIVEGDEAARQQRIGDA